MLNDSEIELLKNELEQEKTYRDSAAWQNQEIEKRIVHVQDELKKEDYTTEFDEDLHKETTRHNKLVEGNAALKDKIPLLKEKIRNAKNCGPDCKLKHDDLNINLDVLTPAELLRTVKKFERTKTDLISTLRSKEWRLDSEAKLYVRLNDQRTYLQNELLICQNNIMRLKKETPFIRWSYLPKRNDQRKFNMNEKLPPITSDA